MNVCFHTYLDTCQLRSNQRLSSFSGSFSASVYTASLVSCALLPLDRCKRSYYLCPCEVENIPLV
ncbi:hypothetical protein K431DRAFT_158278 [Polychaeton citri CBS 116435]|uniref:Uncharacterized protein n=1 Tax=Polychaeton citri CBS 116435 TaxID=1314669 RepID=A0A9P4Q0X5_9PEZI|nr:hypothetical protein K431DRAFT_158278 [Polychaeton citri CBS 116435]